MSFRRACILVSVCFVVHCAMAGVPEGYYNKANGKKKEELKVALKSIIGNPTVLEYGSGAGRTWSGFYSTDRYNGNQVRDRYSNEVFYFSNTANANSASAPAGMNIEHSFAKSWWGGESNKAYKDLFNLMPCEQKINSSKSNYVMGKVTSTVITDNGCTKVGKTSVDGKTFNVWEPADEWKGDFARTYFYMVTSYSDFTWKTDGVNMLEQNHWPTLKKWAYELLLKWHREDPIDDIERERNEAVYLIQGNRNPFVDYPNLAEYIWGDSIEYAFIVDSSFPDSPDDDLFEAYEADEIVSSIYSCRFDARWEMYKVSATYILDVYTKDDSGARTSLPDFPVETQETSYRVKNGVKPSTTYYYQVTAYEDGVELAQSNEVRVDFPAYTPVFTAAPSVVNLTATPGNPSSSAKIEVTMMHTQTGVATVQVEGPFEIAMTEEDGWDETLTLSGSTSTFYVRLASQRNEGDYTGLLMLNTEGVDEVEVPLMAKVGSMLAFFEDFENGSKASYAEAEVRCTAATWYMKDALIGKDTNAEDVYSARIKSGGYIEMMDEKSEGCDSLWFYAGNYNKDTGAVLTVSYTTDGGENWIPVIANVSLEGWQRYGYEIQQEGNIRLKFEVGGTSGKRINVDNIQMSDYNADTRIVDIIGQVRAKTDGRVYDLTGRRIDGARGRGLYIVDGKKCVCP